MIYGSNFLTPFQKVSFGDFRVTTNPEKEAAAKQSLDIFRNSTLADSARKGYDEMIRAAEEQENGQQLHVEILAAFTVKEGSGSSYLRVDVRNDDDPYLDKIDVIRLTKSSGELVTEEEFLSGITDVKQRN